MHIVSPKGAAISGADRIPLPGKGAVRGAKAGIARSLSQRGAQAGYFISLAGYLHFIMEIPNWI
jgi:hypothetical protein